MQTLAPTPRRPSLSRCVTAVACSDLARRRCTGTSGHPRFDTPRPFKIGGRWCPIGPQTS